MMIRYRRYERLPSVAYAPSEPRARMERAAEWMVLHPATTLAGVVLLGLYLGLAVGLLPWWLL